MKTCLTVNDTAILFDYRKKAVELENIRYFESAYGNYTIVKLQGSGQLFSSFTLKHYSSQLSQKSHFFVIRKGLMINVNYLSDVEHRADGLYAILNDGMQFRMSRRKGKELLHYLEGYKINILQN